MNCDHTELSSSAKIELQDGEMRKCENCHVFIRFDETNRRTKGYSTVLTGLNDRITLDVMADMLYFQPANVEWREKMEKENALLKEKVKTLEEIVIKLNSFYDAWAEFGKLPKL